MSTEPLELSFTVACSPDHAFATWAERTSLWWPHGHSVSGEPGLAVTIEPRRLRYLWHLRFDRADATEVEISFAPAPDGTAVTIVHRGWERLGAKGPERRARSERGWGGVIPHYVEACAATV
jgi:Activator of Hsp90 ATPase homolog 1-like protein